MVDDYQESTTINFDWRIRGLKDVFEASKDEGKPKAIKSPKFGGGLWQLLFYPNAGAENGQYVSLFLTCEPSVKEKEEAVDNKWIRKGTYNFTLEIRNNAKTMLLAQKEAANRSFSWQEGANWGWQQFVSRNTISQNNSLRMSDSMIVSCRVSSSPLPVPAEVSPITQQSVPIQLVNVMGSLLDDPVHSDVEFVISRRSANQTERSILAATKVLRRYDYFESMFGMGFAEATTLNGAGKAESLDDDDSDAETCDTDWDMSIGEGLDTDGEKQNEKSVHTSVLQATDNVTGRAQIKEDGGATTNPDVAMGSATTEKDDNERSQAFPRDTSIEDGMPEGSNELSQLDGQGKVDASSRNSSNASRIKVFVNDAAYTTYRAVLFYIYTDRIYFAPLASSFLHHSKVNKSSSHEPKARKEWIQAYMKKHPNRSTPVSAKAVFRLADKLGMTELRTKAFQHIIKSLTIENVPYEMFSSFSAIFDDVRKAQIDFFLRHWNEIRSSEGMATVWQQIRAGRHPGFEEVWPRIATNLEFNPAAEPVAEKSDGQDQGRASA